MRKYKAVTFDFWGTLVDVDASGSKGMAQVLGESGLEAQDARAVYISWDDATVRLYRSGPWRPYVECALQALREVLEPLGVAREGADWEKLADLLLTTMTGEAKPHPEVPAIIARLRERYPLMPITNMDNRLFRLNPFGTGFPLTVTAEDAQAFKPSALIFRHAIEKLGLRPDDILHVSLSQFADLEGAMPMGMDVAWINRHGDPIGRFTPKPRYEYRSLEGLKEIFPFL